LRGVIVSFIVIDGLKYGNGVLIDCGKIPQAEEKTVKEKFRVQFGSTPVPVGETIPWKSERLI
jgi:hypothetical protein